MDLPSRSNRADRRYTFRQFRTHGSMMRWILFLAVLASLQQGVRGARCDCVKSGDDVDCQTNYVEGCTMYIDGVAGSVLKAGTFDGMKVRFM